MPDSLSPAAARRVALAAQGFGRPRPATVGTRQLNLLLERIRLLQIDSVNVLERSHYLPVFARLGGYDKTLLDRLTLRPKAPYLEYWAHVAAIIARDDLPLWRWQMDWFRDVRFPARHPGRLEALAPTMARIRAELAAEGPRAASEFERETARARGPWWDWDDVKEALERMFLMGELVTAGRRGFERVYALPEQVLPPALLDTEVAREEAIRALVERAVHAHGIGTLRDLADYFRLAQADTRAALTVLEEQGRVRRVSVPGWGATWMAPEARIPRRIEGVALLSPFDPVVWERERALRLFDFHYRIEIYTPAPKRVYGYYTLPVLVDEAIAARVDLKNDRQAGVLRVQSAWREPYAPADVAERIAPELHRMAAWQGLDAVEVAGRGDLAEALAVTLRR
ncbi:MAG: YcaQ family DNA glycosylase [Actinomycetales bacterium]|nr:YcaQ family DNA glycosylase [Actinomycetales bacterium]